MDYTALHACFVVETSNSDLYSVHVQPYALYPSWFQYILSTRSSSNSALGEFKCLLSCLTLERLTSTPLNVAFTFC
jgi:hypothetical protein